jgi:hypothetical protein
MVREVKPQRGNAVDSVPPLVGEGVGRVLFRWSELPTKAAEVLSDTG